MCLESSGIMRMFRIGKYIEEEVQSLPNSSVIRLEGAALAPHHSKGRLVDQMAQAARKLMLSRPVAGDLGPLGNVRC